MKPELETQPKHLAHYLLLSQVHWQAWIGSRATGIWTSTPVRCTSHLGGDFTCNVTACAPRFSQCSSNNFHMQGNIEIRFYTIFHWLSLYHCNPLFCSVSRKIRQRTVEPKSLKFEKGRELQSKQGEGRRQYLYIHTVNMWEVLIMQTITDTHFWQQLRILTKGTTF